MIEIPHLTDEQQYFADLEDENEVLKRKVEALDGTVTMLTNMNVHANDELREIRPYAAFYKKMMAVIRENPTLIAEWQSFCVLMKLTDPGISDL